MKITFTTVKIGALLVTVILLVIYFPLKIFKCKNKK